MDEVKFDKEVAKLAADAVLGMYSMFQQWTPGDPKATVELAGFELTSKISARFGDKDEEFAFFALGRSTAVLAFRGTQTPMEWVANGIFSQVPFLHPSSGHVHSGFLAVYQTMRDAVLSNARQRRHVIVTGHSLGAALALLAAADIAASRVSQASMVSFAGPRVGDHAFAGFVRGLRYSGLVEDCKRFVNVHDLVTMVPPEMMFDPLSKSTIHFKHVDDAVIFSRDLGQGLWANHAMAAYAEALEEFP